MFLRFAQNATDCDEWGQFVVSTPFKPCCDQVQLQISLRPNKAKNGAIVKLWICHIIYMWSIVSQMSFLDHLKKVLCRPILYFSLSRKYRLIPSPGWNPLVCRDVGELTACVLLHEAKIEQLYLDQWFPASFSSVPSFTGWWHSKTAMLIRYHQNTLWLFWQLLHRALFFYLNSITSYNTSTGLHCM